MPTAARAQRDPRRIRTVSELNAAARSLLEENFNLLWVRGEVSNLQRYPSGHWYFSLKDDAAQVRAVMFASRNRFVRVPVRDGLEVIARARPSVYVERGHFQVVVERIEPAGAGAAQLAFERLKERLRREGLFDAERKRPLPRHPRRIAVVSSRNAAALRDVLAVLRRRFPCVRAECFYVAVQGAEAEAQILRAFDRIERAAEAPDVVILARGGGAQEDLAAFNLESVARRIAASQAPVIAAIGHETDVTLADFAADRRAPTPSAAAELATPDGAELAARFGRLRAALGNRMRDRLGRDGSRLRAAGRRLADPVRQIEARAQRADELAARLDNALRAALRRSRTAFAHRSQLLARCAPDARIAAARARLDARGRRLDAAMAAAGSRAEARLGVLARALGAVSPLATLARGYAIVARPDGSRWGEPVISARGAEAGDRLVAHLADGRLDVVVEGCSA